MSQLSLADEIADKLSVHVKLEWYW